MCNGVVHGQQHGTAANHRPPLPHFVGESRRVLPDGGVGDQPCLRVTVANTEPGEAADDPVQRKPADAFPHDASLRPAALLDKRQTVLLLPSAYTRHPASAHFAEFRQLRPSTTTLARTVSARSTGSSSTNSLHSVSTRTASARSHASIT